MTLASKNRFFFLSCVFCLLVSGVLFARESDPDRSDESPPVLPASNLNIRIQNESISFPLVIKFKGYKTPEELPSGLLLRTNFVQRTNMVTNRTVPGFRTNAGRSTAARRKKKTEEDSLLEQGTDLFRNGEYPAAVERFRELTALAPDSPQADSGRIHLSRIFFASNDLPAAFRELDAVAGKKSEASYWRIVYLVARTNDSEAVAVYARFKQAEEYDLFFCDAFLTVRTSFLRKKIGGSLIRDGERFLEDRRVTAGRDRILFALGDLYEKDRKKRNMKKAHGYYTEIGEKYPASPHREAADRRAGHIRRNFLEIR